MQNKGEKNEYEFINYLNNKQIRELNPIVQDLLETLYGDVEKNCIVYAKKYGYYAKTDITITINNVTKGLSLKSGIMSTIHQEKVYSFIEYINDYKKDEEIKEELLKYIFSDNTNNNTGKIRITAQEYQKNNYDKMIKMNKVLNEQKIKKLIINRTLITGGKNYRIKPDAIILGYPDDFIWITISEAKKFLEQSNIVSQALHVGKLYIHSWNKNLRFNKKYEHCREYIQVKWYSLHADMLRIMCEREKARL